MRLLTQGGILLGAVMLVAFVPVREDVHEESCCDTAEAALATYVEHAVPPPAAANGKVRGKVLFGGKERPVAKPEKIDGKSSEGCTSGKVDSTNRSLLISASGGVKNAVITIAVPNAKVKVPKKPIGLDQIACRFEPHVLLIPAGATAEFLNSDKISHNVHLVVRKNRPFNRTVAAGKSEKTVLKRAEAIRVGCDLHPWMECYLFVTDTPYTVATDSEGRFELPDVPPGEYEIKVWHEKLGKTKSKVTIAADGSSTPVEIVMAPKSR